MDKRKSKKIVVLVITYAASLGCGMAALRIARAGYYVAAYVTLLVCMAISCVLRKFG